MAISTKSKKFFQEDSVKRKVTWNCPVKYKEVFIGKPGVLHGTYDKTFGYCSPFAINCAQANSKVLRLEGSVQANDEHIFQLAYVCFSIRRSSLIYKFECSWEKDIP